jgi:hypothetical protein
MGDFNRQNCAKSLNTKYSQATNWQIFKSILYFRSMKKNLVLILLFLGFVFAASAQTYIDDNEYEMQPEKEGSDFLVIRKGRVTRFTMTIDSQQTIVVSPKINRVDFVLKNIPAGPHTIHLTHEKKWLFKDSLNQTFKFTTIGDGRGYLYKAKKLRYNTGIQIARTVVSTVGFVIFCNYILTYFD